MRTEYRLELLMIRLLILSISNSRLISTLFLRFRFSPPSLRPFDQFFLLNRHPFFLLVTLSFFLDSLLTNKIILFYLFLIFLGNLFKSSLFLTKFMLIIILNGWNFLLTQYIICCYFKGSSWRRVLIKDYSVVFCTIHLLHLFFLYQVYLLLSLSLV